jgi:hypothetical protein
MKIQHAGTAAALMALLGGTASAQGAPDEVIFSQGPKAAESLIFEKAIGLLAIEPLEMGEPVQDAPYSADVVTEITQELADGNRIERRMTGSVARDGRGRVRREQSITAIGAVLPEEDMRRVTITDPASGVHHSLEPTRKTAFRAQRTVAAAGVPAGVQVPAEITADTGPGEPAPDAQTETLGTREIEGVTAEGTRTTITLAAGAIGNVRPIETVTERWYSPELRVVVLSRRADPRFGETIYRLTNIVRGEPDPALFEVPADYKTEDIGPPSWKRDFIRAKPPQ